MQLRERQLEPGIMQLRDRQYRLRKKFVSVISIFIY